MIDFEKKTLLITGSNGMLGQALLRNLENFPTKNIIEVDLPIDLRNQNKTEELFRAFKPDYVIHTAAKVGGIKANSDNLVDFFIDNIRINTNVLDCCHKFKIKKTISLLSTCVYPDKVSYPLIEDYIHYGPPHMSNYTYAYTKRMLDVQSRAYRDQFKENFITVIPNNLYGQNDNFNLESSHVIPAIIRKIFESKLRNSDVEIWGNGQQLREFTYVDDLARILIFLLEKYDSPNPINVGNIEEYKIIDIVNKIVEIFDFKGKIYWDITKPIGQLKKPSSNKIFTDLCDFKYTNLNTGLIKTCMWFKNNYPNIRGF
ncbi:MAG: GDP-L-fucose synthase [Patescibacteria group bacterium]|jgi:GDP-L-fucose synthase